jgi:hypothetical protein
VRHRESIFIECLLPASGVLTAVHLLDLCNLLALSLNDKATAPRAVTAVRACLPGLCSSTRSDIALELMLHVLRLRHVQNWLVKIEVPSS